MVTPIQIAAVAKTADSQNPCQGRVVSRAAAAAGDFAAVEQYRPDRTPGAVSAPELEAIQLVAAEFQPWSKAISRAISVWLRPTNVVAPT
jgi:hypothetical protein